MLNVRFGNQKWSIMININKENELILSSIDIENQALINSSKSINSNHSKNNDAAYNTADKIKKPRAISASKSLKLQQKKQQILQAFMDILAYDKVEKITNSMVAKKAGVTSTSVSQNFNSKSGLFIGVIEFIEEYIFTSINQIEERYENGIDLLEHIILMLLEFVQSNPGVARVINNEVLFYEEKQLQVRIQKLFDRIEASLKQAYRICVAQDSIEKGNEAIKTSAILLYIIGCCHKFSLSGFQKLPLDMWKSHRSIFIA
jgi:TetR/AcrR family transcriptional regulator